MCRDDAYVLDMLVAGRRAVEVVAGRTKEEFLADWKLQSAVQYQLMVLGEAVKRLSNEFRQRHPQIPWTAIAGHRDILIHQYDAVDAQEVWKIVTVNLPPLVGFLESIVSRKEPT
jgi:uncharacterized protein with HEPN domain